MKITSALTGMFVGIGRENLEHSRQTILQQFLCKIRFHEHEINGLPLQYGIGVLSDVLEGFGMKEQPPGEPSQPPLVLGQFPNEGIQLAGGVRLQFHSGRLLEPTLRHQNSVGCFFQGKTAAAYCINKVL